MGWSPPKKITVTISLLFEILGLFLGLVAFGIIQLEDFSLSPEYEIVGLVLCFVGWLILLAGVLVRGL